MTPYDTDNRLRELSLSNPFVHRLLSLVRQPGCTDAEDMQAYKVTVIALAESNEELKQKCAELLAQVLTQSRSAYREGGIE